MIVASGTRNARASTRQPAQRKQRRRRARSRPRCNSDCAEFDSFLTGLVFNGELRGGGAGLVEFAFRLRERRSPRGLEVLAQATRARKRPPGRALRAGRPRRARLALSFSTSMASNTRYQPAAKALQLRERRLMLSRPNSRRQLGRSAAAGMVAGALSIARPRCARSRSRRSSTAKSSEASMPATGMPRGGRRVPGPDVIVGDLDGAGAIRRAAVGTQVGLAIGTTRATPASCNLNWFEMPNNDHPVIPQNLYRMSGGADQRRTASSRSGSRCVKHAFTALDCRTSVTLAATASAGTQLGSGCSDPVQSPASMPARTWSVARLDQPVYGRFSAGRFRDPTNSHTGHTHLVPSHRILVEISRPGHRARTPAPPTSPRRSTSRRTSTPGASHIPASATCITTSRIAGSTSPARPAFSFSPAGPRPCAMTPAINAWTGATLSRFEPAARDRRHRVRRLQGDEPVGRRLALRVRALQPEPRPRDPVLLRARSRPASPSATSGFHAPPQHPGWAGRRHLGERRFQQRALGAAEAPDDDRPGARKLSPRTRTRTPSAGAPCTTSGSTPTVRRLPERPRSRSSRRGPACGSACRFRRRRSD